MKLGTTVFAAALASALFAGGAQAQDTVKIGWAIAKSGPMGPGAAITTLPNYQVWVKDVNDAGGLNVKGKKMKIEVIEYDDRSNSEEMIKAVERLATQDKVDFILPPWNPVRPIVNAPVSRAIESAFSTLGELPLALKANTTSSLRRKPRSCSAKMSAYETSFAHAVISGTLSVRARARKRRRPG